MNDIGPEWRLLELIARGDADARRERIGELLASPAFHWGELLEQALRHKLLPMVASELLVRADAARIPRMVGVQLRDALRLNQYRMSVFRREAGALAADFERAGLRVACTKGMAIEHSVYGGRGARWMADVDFLIDPSDRGAVTAVLDARGDAIGFEAWETGAAQPLPREEMLGHQLNPDHLPARVHPTRDPLVPYVGFDFAFSFTWARSEWSVPVTPALQRRQIELVEGVAIPLLAPFDHFLFIVLHLFREAWIEKWVELEQDVNLIKFADVLRFWRAYQPSLATADSRERIAELGIAMPVAWVLSHLDRLFGTAVSAEFGLDASATHEWLASAGATRGKQRSWSGDMRARLISRHRGELFTRGQ